MVKHWLDLIRWKNLLIAGVSVLLMKYAVFEPSINYLFPLSHSTLNFFETFALSISVILIAAAGYFINDINDIRADKINKPDKVIVGDKISLKAANFSYYLFNISGIFIAAYVGKLAGNYKLAILHLIVAALLWIYSSHLKNSFLIGNIIVSLSSALVPLTYFLFEGLGYAAEYGHILSEVYKSQIGGPLEVLFYFSVGLAGFGFIISLIREIIKDIQDYNGDFSIGAKTLPIVLGEKLARIIIIALIVVFALLVTYVLHFKLSAAPFNETPFIIYVWLLVITPLADIIFGIIKAKESKDYQRPSNTCKFIMLTGTLTTLIYAFNV